MKPMPEPYCWRGGGSDASSLRCGGNALVARPSIAHFFVPQAEATEASLSARGDGASPPPDCRFNLIRHVEGFPTADELPARIKPGNPNRGREAVGEGHDTEGSRWIITLAAGADAHPLNIAIWGGQTELAQALWRVRQDRGPDGVATFVRRLRIHDFADQDDIAEWMWHEFPGVFNVLIKAAPGRDRREAAFRGLYLGDDDSLVSREWMKTNSRLNPGPLGALCPPWTWTAPNPHSAIKEGDTPS